MDLSIIEKPVAVILINCNNQTVIAKVEISKNNMKSSRQIKRWLKYVTKMKNFKVITLDYIHTVTSHP
jgi:hypothetical protein